MPRSVMPSSNLLLFTDQSQEPANFLKSLLQDPNHARSLYPFIQASISALKHEVRLLRPTEQKLFVSMDSIAGLIAQAQAAEKNLITSTVLLCIAQLCSLQICLKQNPNLLVDDKNRTYLLGLCTGFLPAVVAATCKNREELVDFGSKIVCVALRLAVEVHHRSQVIENTSGSWSTVIRGVSQTELKDILDEFHITQNVPPPRYTYISASSAISSTISGPPSTVKQLFAQSQTLAEAQKAALPIYGAFHARHLSLPDIEHIVAPAIDGNREIRRRVFILSPSMEGVYRSRSVTSILSQGLQEIIQVPISHQSIIEQTATHLKSSPTDLLVVGPQWGTSSICSGLRAQGVNLVEDQFSAQSHAAHEINDNDGIAIIGMSGRFPGGSTLEEFWKTLEEGRELHAQIPRSRFNASKYFDSYTDKEGNNPPPLACFIDELGFFDTHLFSMSPREAKQTDPTQRLLMMATYEALEMAGYSRDRYCKVGTYFGQTTDDWRESNAGQDPDVDYVPGNIRAFSPGRLNDFFGWDGPSYSVDTACSSSLAAVELACNALRLGDCDMAVAGGGNVLTGPIMVRGLSSSGFLSPTGSCKTFDDEADGYYRGEAVGVVILKPLRKAIADNDNIYGIVRSIATNHSAEAISIAHAHQDSQEQLFSTVLGKAGLPPSSVDYVELHGTGSQAGDSIEVASVESVFGNSLKLDQLLYIGAVKANMGHSGAAAGVTSLIKALMMFQKSRIPPHVGIKGRLNHKLDYIDDRNVRIPGSNIRFESRSGQERRRIMVNNFNAAGGKTSLLLEEYLKVSKANNQSRSHYPVVVSAKSLKAFDGNKTRLLHYLEENGNHISLPDLSYTTTSRRLHHPFRTSYSATSVSNLMQQIAVDKKPMIQENRDTPTTVFSFAGQSTDNRGIAKTLFSSCAGFHNSLVSHEKIVLGLGFPSILEYLTGDDDGSPSWPIVEQLSLVSFEIAMAEIWKSWGISPSMVIGHGLGEYSALCVAGALSVADAIYVVGKRAKLMQTRCSTNTHAMLTTPLSLKSAQEHCTSFASCEISCINGPNSTVISGSQEDLRELQSRLDLQGIKAKALVASYAFHSAQMDRILFPLREIIQSVSFSVPTVPILSSLLGTVIEAGNVIEPDYLLRHVRRPVNFVGAVQSREYDQSTTWLECGPEPGCQSMIKTLTNTAQTNLMPGLKKGLDCWKSLCENLATFYLKGQEIRWSAFYKDSDPNLRLLDLPPYAFDTQNFYINLKEADIQDTPTRKRKRTQKPLSTCVQFVEEENIDPRGDATIRFVSDPKQEQLLAAIEGHCVQGHSLCPSSVYVDMAVTSARHLYCRRNNVGAGSAIEVTDIEIFRPLVVLSAGPDMQVSVQPRMSLGYGTVHVSIGSQQTNETLVHHSTCKVQFRDNEAWKDEWARYADMITARMNQLVSMERKQEICRIPGKILYQMYASIVDYNEKYRSISDIYIDCDHKEACGTIHLPVALEYGKFTCCPYSMDGIIHFAGFLLNNGIGRVKDTAYISTGLESIRILQDRLTAKSYQIYSRMKESKEKSYWVGDVYLLDGEEIVATCFGLKFQQMKLTLLNHLLGGSKVGLGTNNEI